MKLIETIPGKCTEECDGIIHAIITADGKLIGLTPCNCNNKKA